MSKYQLYPCDKCGRQISQGYMVGNSYYCKRCYSKFTTDNWLDKVIKLDNERTNDSNK